MLIINKDKKIALVCTGSTFSTDDEVISVQKYLSEQYQLSVICGKDTCQWLPPQERAEIFLNYLRDDEVTAIWVMRGGEGTSDMMPYLHEHKDEIGTLPETMLIGFSDFTPILNYFSQQFHWKTVHAIGALRLVNNTVSKKTEKATMQLMLEGVIDSELNALVPLNKEAKAVEELRGEVCGGTLSLLAISINDVWEVETKDKIIIIEDVAEKPHVIYRTLKYLQRVGFLKQAKAIVFGDFETAGADEGIAKVLNYFARDNHLPIYKTNTFGHGETNIPLVFSSEIVVCHSAVSPGASV